MSASEAGEAAPVVPEAPAAKWPVQVRIAFWVFIAVIAFRVALIPFTIVHQWALADALLHSETAKYGERAASDAQGMMHGTSIVADLMVVALYGLCVLAAFALRRGSGWARIILTVLGALSILTAILALGTPKGVAEGLAGAAGIVLLWLKPSNAWFRAGKAARLAAAR
ncbi:hypothetical protein ACFRFH_06770 [Leifsonia sp. NPDC056824]|uniref:hypothetical protein n=1 Tax=Leifsonia sp. NPDC056824 TaxID=3345953 RepID=UPI0036A5491A